MHSKKANQFTLMTSVFVLFQLFLVQRGSVKFVLQDQPTMLSSQWGFFVPKGNRYSIVNIGQEPAQLTFVQLKALSESIFPNGTNEC